MLLHLAWPVVLGPQVRPLRLPYRCAQPGDQCQVAGWGTTASRRGKSWGPWGLYLGEGGRGVWTPGPEGGAFGSLRPELGTVWVSGLLDPGGLGAGPQDYLMFSPISEVQQAPELLPCLYPEP